MPEMAVSATLFIMGLLVIACVITVVSARDHDLMQAIWLVAARYVKSGQRIIALYLVVTGRACSAGRVVFRSAHYAGELAPSVSGWSIDPHSKNPQEDNTGDKP
jgi:hypothetical protein